MNIRFRSRVRFGRLAGLRFPLRRVGRSLACAGTAILLFTAMPVRVRAAGGDYIPGDLYQYEPGGPVDVTATYRTYGCLFDSNGNLIYIQILNGHIDDLKGNVIGFVAQSDGSD